MILKLILNYLIKMTNNIKNIGIDIVENQRIYKIFKKHKNQFLNRVLHLDEIILFNSKPNLSKKIQFLSGRWAIKETLFKTNNHLYSYKLINIKYDNTHKLIVYFCDKLLDNYHSSISHENKYSVAVTIIY